MQSRVRAGHVPVPISNEKNITRPIVLAFALNSHGVTERGVGCVLAREYESKVRVGKPLG